VSDAQVARLRSFGTPQTVKAGEVLYGPGDATYDLIVTEDAIVEIVQPATRDTPEEPLVRFGPDSFLGELNMLTGQAVYLIARVVEDGRVYRITRPPVRQLMAEDSELSDIFVEAFRARREVLTKAALPEGSNSSAARWIQPRSLAASFTGFPVLLVGLLLSFLVVVKEISRLRSDPEVPA
jgi:thioredoxin reductase (NADPH)